MSSSNNSLVVIPNNSSEKKDEHSLVVKPKSSKKKIVFNNFDKYEEAVEKQKSLIDENEEKIQDIEEELRKLKLLEKELEKEEKEKNKAKNKVKKPSIPKIPENQEHLILSLSYFDDPYLKSKRILDWNAMAGHNKEPQVCVSCHSDDNWETILFENGMHICYNCWVSKPFVDKPTTKRFIPLPKKEKENNALMVIEQVEEPKKIDYEEIYPIELDTLRTAFQVLPRPVQKQYEKRIYEMIDSLIENNFIDKRH